MHDGDWAGDGWCTQMIRINLLPKEIQERRRYERYFAWAFITTTVVVVIIIGVWLALGFQVRAKTRDLQSRQELAQTLQAEADAYSVFEEKKSALTARQAVAQQALAGRINWAKVSNEVSLVLPSDVWALGVTANQETGMELTLRARDVSDSPDVGQKSVARTMVRLNDLESLFGVWLKSSVRSDAEEGSSVGVIDFQLSTEVTQPRSVGTPSAPAVPAPPTGTGQ